MSSSKSPSCWWIVWRPVEAIATVCFLGSLAVMFLQVTARYAFGVAVPWTDEASRFLFVGAIFLGAGLCQLRGTQIRVTILLDLFSPGTRRYFELAQTACTVVVAAAMLWGSLIMMKTSWGMTAATLPLTFGWLYGVQAIGFLMVFLISLRDLACARVAAPVEGFVP